MKQQLAALAVFLAGASTPALANASLPYTTLFAFGDSLSDNGNLFLESQKTIPLPPYVDGHFSNGATWVEDLSKMMGLGTLTPFLGPDNGHDFAFGGAQTGTTDINPPNPSNPVHIDLPDQISAYDLLNPLPAPNALYTLDIGANDIMNALDKYGDSNDAAVEKIVSEAVTNTIDSVASLYKLGARALLFYEVPNLGLTPRFQSDSTELQDLASSLANSFNQAVLDGLAQRENEDLGGLKVFALDTYDLLGDVIANKEEFGLSDVTDACWTGGFTGGPSLPCTDPENYLFWDQVHPTAAGHLIAAEYALRALTAVPEPSTWAMMLLGFAGLAYAGYRRSLRRAAA
jgi:phospholipase/lecithinase/hemolysin